MKQTARVAGSIRTLLFIVSVVGLAPLWRAVPEAFNYDRKNPKDVTLKISLDELGLMPKLQWQEFVGVRDLYKQETDAPATIDVATKTLTIKGLQPHRGRIVGIRKY